MKPRRIHFAWLAATLVALGCAHSARELASRQPLPDITLLEEEIFSGHDRIVASGVDEYIAKFQDAGWLTGLSDARALRPLDDPLGSPTKRVGNRQSVFRFPLRVKDVFCFYYLQGQGQHLAGTWKSDATWEERDAVIATVATDIERRRTTRDAEAARQTQRRQQRTLSAPIQEPSRRDR
jgi:hypothetical protein